MNTWDAPTTAAIASSDDLHISPLRADGTTYGTHTWIWSVVLEGRLFVRAYNGKNSRWYQSAMMQRAGRITAAGTTHDVAFTPADPALTERIDEAHRRKCSASPYLPPMISSRTQDATVEISPDAGA
ncbi:DUF2255 family protein [Arthrobacter sp. 2MCAF15]|uniref:DUF2255 family protein n=1 Tax=Arthrobacter sp. 2MCAF15 TaxID=3232984 RepID=UPI003F8F090A